MSKIDTTGFNDKASKDPAIVDLYERNDYLRAYAQHTDLRVRRDGRAAAIGGLWEEGGERQLRWLIEHGLQKSDRLLDLGCGTGRLARRVVPWLDFGNYTGADISRGALNSAIDLSHEEGWADRGAQWIETDGRLRAFAGSAYDIIWAHSVATHLPRWAIQDLLEDLKQVRFRRFMFTYKRGNRPARTGLKQFCYPTEYLLELVEEAGYRCVAEDGWFAAERGGQPTIIVEGDLS